MNEPAHVVLERRGLILVGGDDAGTFLQGLISNDATKAGPARAIYAALLTPQGKYLHDFFIVGNGDGLLIDCERERRDDLLRRLTFYRLRANVTLEARDDGWLVAAVFGGDDIGNRFDFGAEVGAATAFAGGIAYRDPRSPAAGARLILPRAGAAAALATLGTRPATAADYDRHRLALGLPDGSRDLVPEKTLLLEAGLDRLGGIDFTKGCYVGQELTARTRYRANIRKRLYRVTIDGPLPAPGTPVTRDGRSVGEMRSGLGDLGIALLRIDQAEARSESPLIAGEARLVPGVIEKAAREKA